LKQFLAYGNADQVSFRDEEVRASFDYLTVPGTIAAYYADATAGFVLSSGLDYVIDPRTPLFQESLQAPRTSHYSLALWLGSSVSQHLDSGGAGARFDAGFYTDDVVEEMVESVLEQQRNYAGRAPEVGSKIDRYRRLLAKAQGREVEELHQEVRPPSFVLAPYFAVRDLYADPWWGVNQRVWQRCVELGSHDVSPVVAVASADLLAAALAAVPDAFADQRFFWITDFDERKVSPRDLADLWAAVRRSPGEKPLVNMYGGFFSACMTHVGLYGFSNGLGYSESRAWPQLTITGAAPPRYYIRSLHMFAAPAVAQLLSDADPAFACDCSACSASSIVAMNYHLLKRHFALARRWELNLVDQSSVPQITEHLKDSAERFRKAERRLPPIPLRTGHLERWADVLDTVG
jgi:hypothetical protein